VEADWAAKICLAHFDEELKDKCQALVTSEAKVDVIEKLLE